MKRNQIEVFYDGDCPICRWEVRIYRRLDKAQNITWTDIETLEVAGLPIGKTRTDLLGKFHVREIGIGKEALQNWHIGVDAFARIWRALPGFRHFAFLFSVPVIRQVSMVAYKLFLKWQSWDRRRRSGNNAGN